jgi:ribosomal protein L21E
VPDIPWFVYAMLLAPFGLILVAAGVKYLQVRAARDWPSTPGRVVISHIETRKVKVIDSSREDGHYFEERNFAGVTYEYTVSRAKLRNNRISIGEDRGNFEVAETLKRYPVGTSVTVYYNPRSPRDAVLERDMPKGMGGCLAIGTVIVLAIVFGGAIGLHRITDLLGTHLPHPEKSAAVVAFGGFAAAVALFALVMHRQAWRAGRWPVVTGTITLSELERYRASADEDGHRGSMMVRSKLVYFYRYEGQGYTGTQSDLTRKVAATSRWLVRQSGNGYANGERVQVWVNPANPSQATLDPSARGVWVLWLVAAAIAGVAYYAGIKA